ncbi:MAG: hypothetical protein WCJ71_10595, partial [Candidatus Omnitrophota bacterium]
GTDRSYVRILRKTGRISERSDAAYKVAGFNRNRWPLCIGMGGRIQSECPAAFERISQTEERTSVLVSQRCPNHPEMRGIEGYGQQLPDVAKYNTPAQL